MTLFSRGALFYFRYHLYFLRVERVDGRPEHRSIILAPVSYLFTFSSLGLLFSTNRPLRVERLSRGAKVLGKIGFPMENYFIAKLKEGGETSCKCS